jgi:hypothetical protein
LSPNPNTTSRFVEITSMTGGRVSGSGCQFDSVGGRGAESFDMITLTCPLDGLRDSSIFFLSDVFIN